MKLVRSIALVGLMGSGKTSVGKRLAVRLGAPFFDSDDEIVSAAGRTIPEIFQEFGEPYFRAGETRVLQRLFEGPAAVIATGGGAFISQENRDVLAAGGVSVWLSADVDVLWSRVKDRPGRPLLENDAPFETLKKLHADRMPFYAQADVRVDSMAGDPHMAVCARIEKALLDFGQAHPDRACVDGGEI